MFAIVALTVALLCTIGNTSVPTKGVVAAVSADILLLDIYRLPSDTQVPGAPATVQTHAFG
jgi:hypothetical protein